MAKSKKFTLPFDKVGGVLVIQRRLITSPAWCGLSPHAKALLTLLQTHWRHDKAVAYGVREAMAKIPCAKGTAQRAFQQLQASGFIEVIDDSLFNSRSGSRARTWRLTWLPWQGRSPTNDWEKRRDRVKNEPADESLGPKLHPHNGTAGSSGLKMHP